MKKMGGGRGKSKMAFCGYVGVEVVVCMRFVLVLGVIESDCFYSPFSSFRVSPSSPETF